MAGGVDLMITDQDYNQLSDRGLLAETLTSIKIYTEY